MPCRKAQPSTPSTPCRKAQPSTPSTSYAAKPSQARQACYMRQSPAKHAMSQTWGQNSLHCCKHGCTVHETLACCFACYRTSLPASPHSCTGVDAWYCLCIMLHHAVLPGEARTVPQMWMCSAASALCCTMLFCLGKPSSPQAQCGGSATCTWSAPAHRRIGMRMCKGVLAREWALLCQSLQGIGSAGISGGTPASLQHHPSIIPASFQHHSMCKGRAALSRVMRTRYRMPDVEHS